MDLLSKNMVTINFKVDIKVKAVMFTIWKTSRHNTLVTYKLVNNCNKYMP